MIRKIDHIVITTTDFDVCTDFYQRLGFTVKNGGDRLEMFAGDFKINVHRKGAELFPHAQNICTGSGDLCFEVDNLSEFVALLEQQNIVVELGIVARTGVRGAMQSVYIRDLDGNLLEFCSYE